MQEQSVETGPSLERSIGLGLRLPALAELTKSVMTCG